MFEIKMPQTVPAVPGFSPSFDYSAFQFDLSLLSDDYAINSLPGNNSTTMISTQQIQINNSVKPIQIKEEVHSPRSGSPHCLYPSPSYPCLSGGVGELSPNYSRDASPAYPASPYYLPQSPQSAQIYPTSPESTVTTTTDSNSKHSAKREKSFDLLTILHESRLLAESLGYKEDSTDCTVPCTPPRTEENMYKNFDVDLLPKKEESNPLLKEILFKEDVRLLPPVNSSISSTASTCSSSPIATSPVPPILEKSSLRDLLFHNTTTSIKTLDKEIKSDKILKETPNCEDSSSKVSDYQLLREVLRDTSFQRKHNLKPMDLRSVGTEFVEDMVESGECVGDLAREQIEPVLSLAIQQLQKDFDNTCVALGIHPEPRRWSAADVEAWVQWARRQLQLPSVPLESFNMDGATLASLTEEDFCRRAPQCGSMLYAQLEIWKAAVEESPRNTLAVSWIPTGVAQSPDNESESPSIVSSALDSAKESCSMYYSDDEDEETNSTNTISGCSKIKSGGSHIHLWQFLKELLQSPGTHGSCIRWLDRNKGVFKIEDSVRVARLWGKRKNRPAMNYDKLSRSIRQYYKKGIMKKTERSQRLVYQFCHPYCL